MSAYKPTIGADFFSSDIRIDGREVGLQLWDTAGQERFLSIGHSFYHGSDCCVIVFDVTKESSFENVKIWKKEFVNCVNLQVIGKCIPFLLVGNKIDMIESRKIVSQEEHMS